MRNKPQPRVDPAEMVKIGILGVGVAVLVRVLLKVGRAAETVSEVGEAVQEPADMIKSALTE